MWIERVRAMARPVTLAAPWYNDTFPGLKVRGGGAHLENNAHGPQDTQDRQNT